MARFHVTLNYNEHEPDAKGIARTNANYMVEAKSSSEAISKVDPKGEASSVNVYVQAEPQPTAAVPTRSG